MSQPAESGSAKPDPEPERLGIAGSGTIACGLAAAADERGIDVTLWGRSEGSLLAARERLGEDHTVEVTGDLDDLAAATLLVEAVVEEQAIKEGVLRRLAAHAGGDALLAS